MRLLFRFLTLFALLAPSSLSATHIVGGEMNYTCLGNNQYQITLTIFRDCQFGVPWFDNPARIGVFNGANNSWIQTINVPLPGINDTLQPILSAPCLVAPPEVCVHTTTYSFNLNLPPIPGGYVLAYQRCCRNETISNIQFPDATGATYGVYISEAALLACNSAPKFNAWPPIYICVNEPINFDQSAFDTDGDSLVYKLCDPWKGGTQTNPAPNPPANPPYQPVVWVNPPYNTNNMLNGTPGGAPLSINPQTGLLTGLPNTIGQFVVGICVEEYRNGQLIGTLRRDFQYNVGVCTPSTAAFFAPEVQCNNLEVIFENQSLSANNYLWFFNDPANPGAFSTQENPSFAFADTGSYNVMLIVEPGTVCSDTTVQTIQLLSSALEAQAIIDVLDCSGTLSIQLQDLSQDSNFNIIAWQWTLSTGQNSAEQNPVFTLSDIQDGQSILIELLVTASDGCTQSWSTVYTASFISNPLGADSLAVCLGGNGLLNPGFNPNYQYAWSPGATLNDPNSPNPLASPTETTTYVALVTNTQGCEYTDSVLVYVPPPITVELLPDTTICAPDFFLLASSPQATQFFWASDPDFNNLISLDSGFWVTPFGTESYYLLLRDSFNCALFDSVTITGNGVNLNTIADLSACLGDSISVAIQNLDPADLVSYQWSPDSLLLNGQGTPEPIFLPEAPGAYWLVLESSNQFGCNRIDSILLNVADTSSLFTDFSLLQCSGFNVFFEAQGPNANFLVWDFGDPFSPGANATGSNPSYTYSFSANYTVTLSLQAGFNECVDPATIPVFVNMPFILPDFEWSYLECSDSLLIQFQNLSQNFQSNFTGLDWFFSNGDTSSAANPIVTIFESQTLEALLVLYSDDGCIDTLTELIPLQLIEISPEDTLVFCFGQDSLPLFPGFDPAFSYSWSPATFLNIPQSGNPLASPTQDILYEVLITAPGGDSCQVTRRVQVLLAPPFSLEILTDLIDPCEDTGVLEAEISGLGLLEWATDAAFTQVFSQDALVTVSVPRTSVSYYIRFTDELGCQYLDSVEVSNLLPAVSFQNLQYLCANEFTTLSVDNLVPGDLLNFQWEPSDLILSGAQTNMPLVSGSVDATYSFQAFNQYGCEVQGSIQVFSFGQVPVLLVSASADTLVLGQSVTLTATNQPGYQYVWTANGILLSETSSSWTDQPFETTLYTVEIIDQNGCRNTAEVLIVVLEAICEEPGLFIPTAFSPNGDGNNDLFRISSRYIDELYLVVYDRWGERIFETRDPLAGWDGSYRGRPLSPDVYAFYLEVRCIGGAEFVRKGNITLLR
jgi:gliding motility-associated-like protein